MRVLLPYQTFGPYHRARVARARPAFADAGLELVPLQLFREQDTYRWSPAAGAPEIESLDLATNGRDEVILRQTPRLVGALGRRRPDVMLVNGWATRDAMVMHGWGAAKGIPRVVVSDSQAEDRPRQRWKEWVKARIVTGCRAAFVGGSRHRRYVVGLGIDPAAVFDGCDVVDNAHFAPARGRREPGRRRLLTVARLAPEKNLVAAGRAFLRFAAARLPAEDWRWSVAGYGAEEGRLAALAGESAGRIALQGFRPYEALPAVYADADLYWQPSLVEPWGLAVNEAMASGLPVLVSRRCGCADDLVGPDTGWTFDPESEEAIVAGLERAAARHGEWARMGDAARDRVRDWDLDRFARGALAAARHALGAR